MTTICHPALFTDHAAVARECAAYVPVPEIQRKYGLTASAIKAIRRGQGVYRFNEDPTPTRRIISIEEESDIVRMYVDEGMSMRDIATHFGLKSKHGVERVLKARGIASRQRGNHPEPITHDYYLFYKWQVSRGYSDTTARNSANVVARLHRAGIVDETSEGIDMTQSGTKPKGERGRNVVVLDRYAEFASANRDDLQSNRHAQYKGVEP